MLIPRQAAPVLRRSTSFCVSPAEAVSPASLGGGIVPQAAPGKKLKFYCDPKTSLLSHKGDGCTDATEEAWPCKPKENPKWEEGNII